MAISPKKYTVSGLATELKRDRRTIGAIIAEGNVEPCGIGKTKAKIKYYWMADIVNAMMGGTELDLQQERAFEANQRGRKLQRENDIEERAVIRFEEIVDILQDVSKQAVSILEALPLNIKRRVPLLKAKDIEYIKLEIAKTRNAVASIEVTQ